MEQQNFDINVIKLGGSSQTAEGYDNLINNLKLNVKNIVVVSAIKGITDKLINFVNSIKNKENPNEILMDINKLNNNLIEDLKLENISFLEKDFDFLSLKMNSNLELQDSIDCISMGETFTAKILSKYLESKNFKSSYLDSIEFINCDSENISVFNNGEFSVDTSVLLKSFENFDILIVPGFRGKNIKNMISIMGRGGSDTTGSIIASSIKAKKYQIWTDVNGIYSSDPNKVNNVNIIKSISYDAAQEISAMGAKVIHPYCIKPCKKYNIPIEVRNTYNYQSDFTTIENVDDSNLPIYAVTIQENNSIFKIESLNMWNNYGFVYDIFSKFKDFNVDVNIINTSQFDITTTTNDTDMEKLLSLKKELEKDYNVNITNNCSLISIIGENVKKYKKLNLIMDAIMNFDIKLTSYSSNDMTLSFMVKKKESDLLANKLHSIIFPFNEFKIPKDIWWHKLLSNHGPNECQYLYNLEVVKEQITKLKTLSSINKIYYAVKANNNVDILKTIKDHNIGFETVSINEVDLIKSISPESEMLFTPNFARVDDYLYIFKLKERKNFKIEVIVDNIDIVIEYPGLFGNKEIGIRLDLDYGFGHCNKVITQGQDSKFGVTPNDILKHVEFFEKNNISIVGLHSHMGSGITNYRHWINNFKLILSIYEKIPSSINKIKWFDIGGGFGIDDDIDFETMNKEIEEIKKDINIDLYIEPGRFLVAKSGIIWGKVTQTKDKNNTKFIGTNIGMTDLIRPALYSAIHPVYFKEGDDKEIVTVVGPICESGDILIKNLLINKKVKINDSVIVSNTGAYGIVMASKYNNRNLPKQVII